MEMTGTALTTLFNWTDAKLRTIEFGTVSITLTVCNSQVVKVDKMVSESEKFQLKQKNG